MTRPLRVLIGCATSCVALDAFLARGHDAWQCDILPSDTPTNRHIQDDVRNVLGWGWDLLIVSNPPCTRLCNSGVRWLSNPPTGRSIEDMWRDLDEGADLFSECLNAPVPRVAVENPVMHRHARERIKGWVKPQIVQPWWFGDEAFKATGLYLRGLSATRHALGLPHETAAARDVLAERRRQTEGEGWTPEHDDAHIRGELGAVAACYAAPLRAHDVAVWAFWPSTWDRSYWKPSATPGDLTARRRDLVKAGALILAEIERLDRMAGREGRDDA